MQSTGRELPMEAILATIKKAIAEEKEMRAAVPPREPDQDGTREADTADDVLELDEPLAPPVDIGPPLLDEGVADASRQSLEAFAAVAATAPPVPQVNPLEEVVRDMLRPILKEWLDTHLHDIISEHVKLEISRIRNLPR